MTTPANGDQGFFYTPGLTASGNTFYLDLDTGSTDTGIAGHDCSSCTGISPLYTPGASASDTGGQVSITYADMSGWSGEVYSDTYGLGHGSPNVMADLVDMQMETSFFSFSGSNEYQGIIGIGRDDLAGSADKVTYLDGLKAAGVTQTLGIEMCPTDGTLWLGGIDESHAGSALVTTPLVTTQVSSGNNAFYSVDMTAMLVGSASVGLTASNAEDPILDTGTSLFYIPTAVETKVIAAINKSASYTTLFGSTLTAPDPNTGSGGCVDAKTGVTDAMVDDLLPALTMEFGTAKITAKPLASYMMNAGQDTNGATQYCMVMQGGGDGGEMIMGDMFLRGFVTEIDITNAQAGFAPTAFCPAPAVVRGPRPFQRPRELGRGPKGWAALKAERARRAAQH